MEFHPEKCQVLRVTRDRVHLINASYYLHGHKLETVKSAKYLGANIQSDLRWNSHVSNIIKKVNSTLGFLKCNIRVPCPKLKEKAYKALVHPHMEYASTV